MMTAEHEMSGGAWRQAHEGLVRLAASRAGLDFEEGQALRAAMQTGAHVRLGYGSFVEYIERLFGYSPRLTYEKLRVAEALQELEELANALRDGQLSWSVVRELTRVATPETEGEWLACAAGRTAHEVQQLVSGHRPGSPPDDPVDELARRHVLRFEVSGEAFAAFREAMAKMRRDAGGPLDDDAALLLLARSALGGPQDEGRASYQLALTVCEKCRTAAQDGRGQIVPVGADVLAMAECDAQHLGGAHVGDSHANAHVGEAHADAHVGEADLESEAAKRDAIAHVGTIADDAEMSERRRAERRAAPRATQTIPPALRRLVLRRDAHRCVFPGCRHATFVDVHHIRTRADGGEHLAENLITVCGAHHRAIHRGEVVVTGCAPASLHIRHADGTAYGGRVAPLQAEIQARAFGALRNMGFGEAEVRKALAHATGPCDELNLESVLRDALLKLTDRRVTRAA